MSAKLQWVKGPVTKGQRIIKCRPGPGAKGPMKWYNPDGEDFCRQIDAHWAMLLVKDGAVEYCDPPKPETPKEAVKRKNTKE